MTSSQPGSSSEVDLERARETARRVSGAGGGQSPPLPDAGYTRFSAERALRHAGIDPASLPEPAPSRPAPPSPPAREAEGPAPAATPVATAAAVPRPQPPATPAPPVPAPPRDRGAEREPTDVLHRSLFPEPAAEERQAPEPQEPAVPEPRFEPELEPPPLPPPTPPEAFAAPRVQSPQAPQLPELPDLPALSLSESGDVEVEFEEETIDSQDVLDAAEAAERLLDEAPPPPPWSEILDAALTLSSSRAAILVDAAGQVLEAAGPLPQNKLGAIADRLSGAMNAVQARAGTPVAARSAVLQLGAFSLTGLRVPLGGSHVTIGLLRETPVAPELLVAVESELLRGALS